MSSVIVDPPFIQPNVRSVAIVTLGCKVNTFESEYIAQRLADKGYRRVSASRSATLYIFNTCTVTAEADRQARQMIRRAVRTNPEAFIVVTGCYAQIDPQTCSDIPGVDLVVGNSQKLQIPDLLDDLYRENLPPIMIRDIDREISLPDKLLQGFDGQTRAFVQVQQGCNQGCTFCIIHTARGPSRSFSADMIKRQCERLVLNGYGEIVLCGVDIGSYGSDLGDEGPNLTDMIKNVLTIEGDFRVRLSSIDPAHITDELIELMAANDRICPQLHLSLQSANTLILKRMKRRATRERLYERIQSLKNEIPDLILSADILVGFPTEDETQFNDTILAINELEICYPHVFSYSSRTGTPASRIPSQTPPEIRKARARKARDMGQQVWDRVAHRQLGRDGRVLVESRLNRQEHQREVFMGRLSNYFPVQFEAKVKPGSWQEVTITGIEGDHLTAATR